MVGGVEPMTNDPTSPAAPPPGQPAPAPQPAQPAPVYPAPPAPGYATAEPAPGYTPTGEAPAQPYGQPAYPQAYPPQPDQQPAAGYRPVDAYPPAAHQPVPGAPPAASWSVPPQVPAPAGTTSTAVTVARLAQVAAVVLMIVGLSLPLDNTAWANNTAWAVFAMLAVIVQLAPMLGSSFGWTEERSWTVGAAATASTVAFWVLVVAPGVSSNQGFFLTAATACAGAGCWFSPGNRW